MILLAVDTTAGAGSLALARQNGRLDTVVLPPEWKSTTLHAELSRLLARNSIRTANLDAYAVASGPGAFTGLRVGLTAVKALAEVHAKPVVAISTLEVLAEAGRRAALGPEGGPWAALLDARRGQVFGAVYRAAAAGLAAVIPDSVGSLGTFLERLRAVIPMQEIPKVRFCAAEMELFAAPLRAAGWGEESLVAVSPALAPTLASMAFERLQRGQSQSAIAAEANYVRASDAELFFKG